MIRLVHDKRYLFVLLLMVTLLVMLMMSYFGFRLKGFRLQNKAKWSDSGIGISFERFAIAYTEDFFPTSNRLLDNGLTIECAIEPMFSSNPGFKFLLLIHDGQDEHQLVLGQWRSSLIIMNGDDYSYRQKVPRISIPMDDKIGRAQLITVVSNASGTVVYLDGRLIKRNKKLVLTYPDVAAETRLVMGNNLHGNRPWQGIVEGVALYHEALSNETVLTHHQHWLRDHTFASFQSDGPKILYAFNKGKSRSVPNLMGHGPELLMPARMVILKKTVLSLPKFEDSTMASLMRDVLINLFGFVPLGASLTATLSRLKGIRRHTQWVVVVLICLCFSLMIEIFQVWIPSRDSSILDLILNTLGGCLGFILFQFFPVIYRCQRGDPGQT